MASTEVNPSCSESGNEPELHLLLAPDTFEPLWKSLFQGLDEFFFPKKLPPLKLESKPIPVKDIWGFYNYKKNGALGSTAPRDGDRIDHRRHDSGSANGDQSRGQADYHSTLIDPGDYTLKPAKTQAGGGGGGGDRDVLKASQGKLPKFSMQQITPPAAVIRNLNPKLPVEPTVIVPPDIKMAKNQHAESWRSEILRCDSFEWNRVRRRIGSGSGGWRWIWARTLAWDRVRAVVWAAAFFAWARSNSAACHLLSPIPSFPKKRARRSTRALASWG